MNLETLAFKGKHIFFTNESDNFFHLIADSLIHKVGVCPENIVALNYDSNWSEDYNKKVQGVLYLNYKECMLKDVTEASSLTFISLFSCNAYMARGLIDYSSSILDRLYIFITDDEVERWGKIYSRHGMLVPSKKHLFSEDDVYVLKLIKNFICPEKYFGELLCRVLSRNDFRIINSTVIFDILDSRTSAKLQLFIDDNEITDASTDRVLIGTKSTSFIRAIPILRVFSDHIRSRHIQFVLFCTPVHRFFIVLYLLFRQIFHRDKYDVLFMSKVSPMFYNFVVASCSHLVLQDRGGASTARLYLKWGRGLVFVKKYSPNYTFFKEAFGTDIIEFEKPSDISGRFVSTRIDVGANVDKFQKEENRSIDCLRTIYFS